MLSYSSCADFYKCPYLFQNRDDIQGYTTTAMQLGANVDNLLNVLMVKHIKDTDFKMKRAVELGISDMLMKMADNNDICKMFDVPEFVKSWYIDFLRSGFEVVDVQKHFIIEDLDYHGYIDAVFKLDGQTFVIENKTTSRYFDKFFTSKKNSMQAVGYALGVGTNAIRYQFFNTKDMTSYCSASRFITPKDVDEFTKWVNFVRENQDRDVKNTEWCSWHDCMLKERCLYEDN